MRIQSKIITLAVAALPFVSGEALAGGEMFRGDAARTGVYNAAGVPRFSTVKWRFQTKGAVHSSPAVADGIVYFGSTDSNVYAVDIATGAQRWKFATKARVTGSPAVANGLVYIESYDGALYALDAKSGAVKWQFATGGERRFAAPGIHGSLPAKEVMPDPFDFYLSSPVIVNGVLYFGSGDTNVYALDAATGAKKWAFKTGDVVHASPAVANGVVYIGSWDANFYALDAATGREIWRYMTGVDPKYYNQVGIQSSAAVADGTVYFGCRDANLYALDAATGAKKWTFNNKGSWVIGSPAVRGGRVYFATSDSGMFYELDAKTGQQTFSLAFAKWPMFSSPTIAGDMLYIGSHSGKFFGIDLKTHAIAWTFATDAAKREGPRLTSADGTPNYAVAYHENFYDDMVQGVGIMMGTGAMLSTPAIVDNVIYVGSADGALYALS